ncbi:xanthine dehydrogenase family protein subunit M [Polynucleobacter sp. 73C-SIWE]|uniref:FAD binding domain-containing protein n=1 Tax=Polynucleobacter sp. 73C-SIWE TaxID=2689098 RepID=UPI001C0CC72A|nr:xanthine dehydrogenase family protein subunit M [Polynucleobacter sp. 73C-SIWE]MBU3579941.1 xanthine dehydrogenase family protein subunit M [Polynucleobacter sp. 73C-SIWE]
MLPFELLNPTSFDEAIKLLSLDPDNSKPIAGGTALMLMMKSQIFTPTQVISLRNIKDGSYIRTETNGELKIGALTKLSDIENSVLIAGHAPVICQAMIKLSNVRVRNAATIGGALSHGDPHMDLPPILSCLSAVVRTISPKGKRTIPVDSLYLGYYETCLEPNELIYEVSLPASISPYSSYIKCTTRSADDWPALGVAVNLNVKANHIESSRIFMGSIADVPTRLVQLEERLTAKEPTPTLLALVADLVSEEIDPVSDHLGSAEYKRALAKVYVKRALLEAYNNGVNHAK